MNEERRHEPENFPDPGRPEEERRESDEEPPEPLPDPGAPAFPDPGREEISDEEG